jgi:hypothetical protein
MPDTALTEPWRSFLHDLDALLDRPTEDPIFSALLQLVHPYDSYY